MESQYINSYLETNKERGENKGLTIYSFLAYRLRGKAKSWICRYGHALHNAVNKRVMDGQVKEGKSKCGKIAFYPLT